MFRANGVFEYFQSEFYGSYSFDILMYRVNGNDDELIDKFSSGLLDVNTNFIKDFTTVALDDIGMHVRFVVFDNTPYLPGMKPLALLAWPNGSSEPVPIRYNFNTSDNILLKRVAFEVRSFKNCVFEFDTNVMRTKILY